MAGDLVLVTGGAGFIGSHLVEALLARGYRVRVLDNLFTGNLDYLPEDPNLEFVQGDVTDYETCLQAMDRVTGVFHMAAMSKVLPSLADPSMIDFCTRQNVDGTACILRAALTHKESVRKLIYSGSSTYYGGGPLPNRESVAHDCQTPYALTKYVGETYCELFTKLHGLPTIRLRYFMAYGPRQPSEGAYAVVTGVFKQKWKAGETLPILGSGKQTRDFIHVSQLAEGNIRAFEADATSATINLGSGQAHTILELAQIYSDDLEFHPPRVPDIPHSLADQTECQKYLGWVPEDDVIGYLKDQVRELCWQSPGKYKAPAWLSDGMSAAAASGS
jgi:nucleoside-diphosphate-sugar epimerase